MMSRWLTPCEQCVYYHPHSSPSQYGECRRHALVVIAISPFPEQGLHQSSFWPEVSIKTGGCGEGSKG